MLTINPEKQVFFASPVALDADEWRDVLMDAVPKGKEYFFHKPLEEFDIIKRKHVYLYAVTWGAAIENHSQ